MVAPKSRAFALVVGTLLFASSAVSQVAVTTYHNDAARTGANTNETILNHSNVNSSQFGKLFSLSVDGQIYAQPLYVPNLQMSDGRHNVLFVATEHNSVYAFDADQQGSPLWTVNFGPSVPSGDGLGISPEVGITSTPVIDLSTNTIYVFAETNDSALFRLHALDLSTGAEKFNGPVVVTATVPGSGTDTSGGNITLERGCWQRSGLALANGNIYLSFGHCAHGWVIAYNATDIQQQTGAVNLTPDGEGGTVWMSGGAPAVDARGYLHIMTGTNIGSFQPGFNNSFVQFGPSQPLTIVDSFTPANNQILIDNDADLGSGAPIVMPDNNSGSGPVHELIGGGKDGRIWVLDRAALGGSNPGGMDNVVQVVQTGTSQYNNFHDTPAYWNGKLYFHSNGDVIRAYSWSGGMISNGSVLQGNTAYGAHGATVSISANGNTDGIAWDIDASQQPNGPAVLHAYNADDLTELYNSTQASGGRDTAGNAVKFVPPTVVKGKVYVAGGGQLTVYGLLNGNTPPFGWVDTRSLGNVAQNTAIQISGWAADKEDGSPVSKVQLLLDNSTVLGNATLGLQRQDVANGFNDPRYLNSGWSFSYNIGTLATGSHTITAIAYDSEGSSAQLSGAATLNIVSNTAPFGWVDTRSLGTVPQNSTVQISGWAADKEDGSPVSKVQLVLDNSTILGNATLGFPRQDVANAFNDSRYANSGWSFSYNTGTLSPGSHTITAIAYDSQGASAQLSGSATLTSTTDTAPFGFIDGSANSADGSSSVPQNGSVRISGWAADKEDGAPVSRVQVLIDGTSVGNATLGLSRPDVAGAFNNSAYTNSGWAISYSVGSLAVGTHTVSAVAYDSQGVTTQLRPSHAGANTFTVTSTGSVQSISHVFFMLQENHSFDNYFGRMGQYRANKGFNDSFDGMPLSASYSDANGNSVSPYHLATVCTEDLAPGWDPTHLAIDGGAMDRFPLETENYLPSSIDSGGRRSMGYYDWTDLPYYYELAFQFGTSDRYFSSVQTRTIPNRMYMFAATSFGHINNDSPPGGGWQQATIFDRLDAAGVKWRVYRVDETNSLADWATYSRDSGKVFPISQYFTDVKSESTTPQVVFIDRGGGSAGADEHPGSDIQTGAAEVAKIINALLASPSWHSSAFFLSWDEPGGFYDHVAPAAMAKPDNIAPMLCCGEPSGDFAHSGLRVPVVVVSPWVKPHFVSHVVRDHTSILKFIEDRFGLQPLTARDANADDMMEFFDFSTPHLATPPSLPSQPTNGNCNAGAETANS